MPFKRVNTSNQMTFECCFLISQYHENCNAMSSFTVMYLRTLLQCCSMFSLVCYGFYLLFICLFIQLIYLSFFSDAAYSEHSQLVEIVVERSIFECAIQKGIPRSLQLNKYVIFKTRNMSLRFEIAMGDVRDQLMTNDKLPELS